MPAFGKWGKSLSGRAALGHLLPLMLPPDRVKVTSLQAEILQQDRWVEIAHARGLTPAFYSFLRQGHCWALLSPRNQDSLATAYHENLVNCMVREEILSRILDLFDALGEPPILLKGLAYATELYPDLAARLAGDIDLLVPLSLKEEIRRRFLQSEFQLIPHPAAPPGKLKRLLRQAARACGISNPRVEDADSEEGQGEDVFRTVIGGRNIVIEIHYHLINLRAGGGKAAVFHSYSDKLLSTRVIRLADRDVRVLDRQVAFIHALRHVALHHRLIGLRWHHDLALMLIQWEPFLNREQIREQCRALNSVKILNVELVILSEMFGASVLPVDGQWRREAISLPWEYPLYRYIAIRGQRTPLRELVRTLLAPNVREQLETLT